jgi:glycosyltransferase involved in cell wall biosynthesis
MSRWYRDAVRILLVTTWYPSRLAPSSGIFVAKDVDLLAREHDVHVVHLISPRLLGPDEPDTGPVRVTRIPMSTANPLHLIRARRRLESLIAESDLVHTQAFSALLPFAFRRPKRPWVHTEHWSGVPRPESVGRVWRASAPLALRLLRRPDVVTAVCRYLGDAVDAIRRRRVRIVPCVVEPVADVVERPDPGPRLRLVSVGGLVPGKDPMCAIDTVAELRSRGVDASLEWLGDGPLRDAAADRITALGLDTRVSLAGVRTPAEVGRSLDAADLFLLPTLGENFCVSAAEAIVHGRPVVVGAIGGQGEYLTPETGVLVADKSPGSYADAVEQLVARTRGRTAAQIAATIGDRFSSDSVLRGYEAAYAEASSR